MNLERKTSMDPEQCTWRLCTPKIEHPSLNRHQQFLEIWKETLFFPAFWGISSKTSKTFKTFFVWGGPYHGVRGQHPIHRIHICWVHPRKSHHQDLYGSFLTRKSQPKQFRLSTATISRTTWDAHLKNTKWRICGVKYLTKSPKNDWILCCTHHMIHQSYTIINIASQDVGLEHRTVRAGW